MVGMEPFSPTVSAPAVDLEARGQFILRVYGHLLGAIAAFMAIETVFFATGIAEGLYDFVFGSGGMAWLLIFGAFMIGSSMASRAAADIGNQTMQYAGLLGMATLHAVIFAPFLYLCFNVEGGTSSVGVAALITAVGFAALTVVAWTTRKDLSFLRPMIMWGFVGAIVLILAAVIFGLSLGIWFSVGMIVLAGGSILYQTQEIVARYPSEAYVAASVQLFASVMLLFWYVLRLVMALRD